MGKSPDQTRGSGTMRERIRDTRPKEGTMCPAFPVQLKAPFDRLCGEARSRGRLGNL